MWMTMSVVLAACSLGLGGWWLGRPYVKTHVGGDGRGPFIRLLWPWIQALTPGLEPLLTWRMRGRIQDFLSRAGMASIWTPGQFLAYQSTLGGLAAAVTLVLVESMVDPRTTGFISLGVAFVTALWPLQRIREHIRRRQQVMSRAVPFFLDMVTLCVEAGLNLHGALQQAASHGPPGPLRDELGHLLTDIRAGMTRSEALQRWADRCDLPPMHYFVSAVAQADQFGMSLGPVLRAQAEQRRSERFMRAEKLAQQAPVKMMFPLVFCIFPCSFAIIAFPIAVQFAQALQ